MKKRVYIIYGLGGYPEENWFTWLKKELEKRGFKVQIPILPNADEPRIFNWVPAINKAVKNPDEETFFVGHSIGGQAIARYLGTLPKDVKVGGVIFVSGFFKRITGFENNPKVQATDKHWLGTPIDFNKVKSHLRMSVAFFSDNDPYVPLDNQDDFREKLGSKIIIEHNMGHFNKAAGVTKFPDLLDLILKL